MKFAGMESRALELITLGRAGVDLYGEQIGGRLEDMSTFAKYVGGSPTNTTIGAARLGLRTGLLTRVGNDHMGRFIMEQLAREKVDCTGVTVDPDRLTALAILGIRDPETFPLLFYRENCADMALCAEDIDPTFVGAAGALLINGTHLSQPGVLAASLAAVDAVRTNGGRVIFDVDYRPVLWGLAAKDMGEDRYVASDEVTAALQKILPKCDLVVGTEEELHILGGDADIASALTSIRTHTDALIVLKRGERGCIAFPDAIPANLEAGIVGEGFAIDVFNVLGAGDAFMAGFLRGWLRGEDLQTCCTWANACGAIVVSRHGCAPAEPSWQELELFLARTDWPKRLRDAASLEQLHWSTTRHPHYDELAVLAIDHRSQFDELARELDIADPDRIEQFKTLALQAVDRVSEQRPGFGILADGRYGSQLLEAAADRSYWIGRPIELPGSCPIRFEGSGDPATTIASWPVNHVVKCLIFYHPDDPADLRRDQDLQIQALFDACRSTRHELLLEIISSKGGAVDAGTVAVVIDHIYSLGVFPDWWKLEPNEDPDAWHAIEATIARWDPHCRGIVLLGLSAPREYLRKGFSAAAGTSAVRGFAVGRTIWNEPARLWLTDQIDSREAVDMLADNFLSLVSDWRACRTLGEATA